MKVLILYQLLNLLVIAEEERKLEEKKKESYAAYLFHKLFFTEIFKKVHVAKITQKDVWAGRNPPNPLNLEAALSIGEVKEVMREKCNFRAWMKLYWPTKRFGVLKRMQRSSWIV